MLRTAVVAGLLLVGTLTGLAPAHAADAGPSRIRSDGTRLYDTTTNATFTPRGANYIRLADDGHGVFHSTFEPGRYSPTDAQRMLNQLSHDGYNTVRVFVDAGTWNFDHGLDTDPSPDAPWLNKAYVDNLAAFIDAAAADHVYVLPTFEYAPMNRHYADIAGGTRNPNVGGTNSWYLDRGMIAAKKAYLTNIAAALEDELGVNRTDILSYEIDNEVFWQTDQAPFATMSGTVVGVDGITYDMSAPADRQQAADASLVWYVNQAVQGVHAADPDALVSIGMFTNNAVGRTGFDGLMADPNTRPLSPGNPVAIAHWSAIDFIDMHTYPWGAGYTPAGDLASSDLGRPGVEPMAKPYLVGELGARKDVYGNDITSAALDLRDRQIQTCHIDRGAQGWLLWTYDTDQVNPDLAGQGDYYSLTDSGGAINGQLAPIVRPDPCR
ncbi:hypothetical protein [Kutzneria sp. 744]|uniref:hypothetical protein n=1 Tax=Kutzneria sp. (strain 744) TaxID=345341 RepID=UPI0003EEB38E|nr:hypothetical protein [Kutzneria sp. 744]EWM16285.1 PE-PGRS family protein [Kutzneria sp. 744]